MSNKVGPGNPPVWGRFKKGSSGNPKGRPRKDPKESLMPSFDVILNRSVGIENDGIKRQATAEEALLHQTLLKALDGENAAIQEICKTIVKREEAYAKWLEGQNEGSPQQIVDKYHPRNADKAMLLLGIACLDPKYEDSQYADTHLLLEPWAVQMALSRRRGGRRLSADAVKTIKEETRDPDTLSWSRSAGK